MSKPNNVNPNFYYEGDRNHQGEGIVHEEHKQSMNRGNQPERFVRGAEAQREISKAKKKK